MIKSALIAALISIIAFPALAEPVENTTEVAQLLESLGDRCWAVDLDGDILDAAALSSIEGPIDIELECIVADKNPQPKPLPASII